ncbi:nitrite/sulfite reductase [Frankia sp. CNm7]|uniref:assimilatory sulfite reductase (ferredoxin) n=1 Tax=Frankia nepalensis TaxID=1836974 RepID=A0A937RKM9_9ACTN|nr:nitrite/sulfite reductase [Frankia nepalensis]MBL7496051.1 nitrite/sulfite reductase [Frankia nepalensis]MBL7511828.1 nitrite/sulfite reductase [Frankia nepalensis]MBL7517227.1 nitrite/sulfite reductase [Frankia nepalensis]MBL7630655.1 nitrite/sulfite reductase [Frankia nepalensis]
MTSPARPRSARPARPKGQGQWALGYSEPLNANERMKKDQGGLEVRDRILNRYPYTGFDSIDPQDLRGRFRWWGLYTQRKPGIDGGRTAILEPEEIEDSYFMQRIRLDGGRMTSDQLRVIGDISTRYGRDVADVTDRQNIQLHWIRIEDVPAIWGALEANGMTTQESCGDTPRVMLGCPLAGVDGDEIIDATPVIDETVRRFVGDPSLANLPRKFKSAMSGCADHCTLHEINDIAFVGVVHPELGAGYDLWVGGGLSTNPKLGVRLGTFVTPERVAEVWHGVAQLFRDYGYRRMRTRARLKFLVADMGVEWVRATLEKEYLEAPLPDGPPPAPPRSEGRDHVGAHRQADGNFAVGFAPRAGRLTGTTLTAVANLADQYGQGRIRATTSQKLVILDVTEADVPALEAALAELDLVVRPSVFRRGTMACTGIEFCKLAIVETKANAAKLIEELERRLPDFDEPIGINVNGCPNACARFQVADIGLKGSLVPGPAGEMVEGFQLHLGGHLGGRSRLGRKSRGLKITSDELVDYVVGLLKAYQADRAVGEAFADWVERADEAALTHDAVMARL